MRTYTLAFPILLAFHCMASLCAEPPPVSEFRTIQSLNEIRNWAEKSFGGYKVDELEFEGNKIVIVDRMLTSGLKSSTISIFRRRSSDWIEAIRFSPYTGDFINFRQHGDVVILNSATTGTELFRLSIKAICVHQLGD